MMKLVQEFIFLKSKALSHRLMIQDGDSTISYMQMDEFTNCLAKLLISRGVLQHDRVALLIPKSINLFKAIFSILKADCGYVPLNISAPISRNKNIIERSQCKKILCTNETEDYAKELIDWNENLTVNLINLDSIDLTSYAPSKLKYKNSPNDLAYLIFTSGSTGAPKGVMISHENILNYAKWASHFFCIQPSDRVSHIPNISFDLSVFDIFPTFISGASLHLVPNSVLSFPIEISRYIDRNKLTIFNAVPSQLALMARFRALDIDLLSSLRAVTFNGEVMPAKILIEWMAACPNARFVNQYGPTETTCASLFYEIKEVPVCSTKSIPIGKPIDNTYVYVLDRDGELIGGNEVGTLYISGKGVGIGYLDGEKHKKTGFIEQDNCKVYCTGDLVRKMADENYEFIGREDQQIKFMGYRIELAEIESILNSMPEILESAVIFVEKEKYISSKIIAFISSKINIKNVSLIEWLGKYLPTYMIPKEFHQIEVLPKNENNKIDRAYLKSLYQKTIDPL